MPKDNHLLAEAIKMGAIPDGWVEVGNTFFQFQNAGDILCGKLVDKTTQKLGNNTVGKYTVIDLNNERIEFNGTTQLDSKMRLIATGHWVHIKFDHTEPSKGENKSDTKIFVVHVPDPKSTMEL